MTCTDSFARLVLLIDQANTEEKIPQKKTSQSMLILHAYILSFTYTYFHLRAMQDNRSFNFFKFSLSSYARTRTGYKLGRKHEQNLTSSLYGNTLCYYYFFPVTKIQRIFNDSGGTDILGDRLAALIRSIPRPTNGNLTLSTVSVDIRATL